MMVGFTIVQSNVQQLKEKLVPLANVPTERQRLIFRGAVLQDNQALASARESIEISS